MIENYDDYLTYNIWFKDNNRMDTAEIVRRLCCSIYNQTLFNIEYENEVKVLDHEFRSFEIVSKHKYNPDGGLLTRIQHETGYLDLRITSNIPVEYMRNVLTDCFIDKYIRSIEVYLNDYQDKESIVEISEEIKNHYSGEDE